MPEEEVAPRSCARMNHSDSKKRRSRSNRDASASLPPIAGGSPGAQGAPNAGLAAGGGAPRAAVEIGAGGRPPHAPASFLPCHPIGNDYPWCAPASSDWIYPPGGFMNILSPNVPFVN